MMLTTLPRPQCRLSRCCWKTINLCLQDASFAYTPSFDYDKYSLNATVSLDDVIRQNEVQNIPKGEIDALEGDG